MSEAIRTDRISYSIGAKRILHNVSLSVGEHNFIGLIGPNGSGKTTLLKHIYRAIPPQEKAVFIRGKEIEKYNYRDSAKEITVLRQENGSDFPYTIFEMVLMGRSPYRKMFESDTTSDKDLARQSLERVGMLEAASRSYGNLSGGEKQRVLIARSLAQEADILLLDEPTNHLDVHYQWSLMETIRKLDKTVLAVFHELNLACSFCDYIYVLDSGQIAAEGKPSEIVTPKLLADIFRVNADVLKSDNGVLHIIYKSAI